MIAPLALNRTAWRRYSIRSIRRRNARSGFLLRRRGVSIDRRNIRRSGTRIDRTGSDVSRDPRPRRRPALTRELVIRAMQKNLAYSPSVGGYGLAHEVRLRDSLAKSRIRAGSRHLPARYPSNCSFLQRNSEPFLNPAFRPGL